MIPYPPEVGTPCPIVAIYFFFSKTLSRPFSALYFSHGGPTAFLVPDHGYGPAHGPKESTKYRVRIMRHALLQARSSDQDDGPAHVKIMAHGPDHIQMSKRRIISAKTYGVRDDL